MTAFGLLVMLLPSGSIGAERVLHEVSEVVRQDAEPPQDPWPYAV